MSAFFGSLAFKLLAPLLLVAVLAAAYLGWESRIRRAAIIEAQRDQLAAAIKQRDEWQRQASQYQAAYLALKPDRLRRCAVQGPQSGCCKPEPAECKP